MIVIENPMLFTIVSDAPLDSAGAFCATNVENNGESAITTRPQKKRKISSTKAELLNKNSGERTQHKPDKNNEMVAIFLVLKRCDNIPLKTQAMPPEAITRKDKRETFKLAWWK